MTKIFKQVDEVDEDYLMKMKLHEQVNVFDLFTITRVVGGWLYDYSNFYQSQTFVSDQLPAGIKRNHGT